MFIRAYLRASTREQDALRAKDHLAEFAAQHGERIASWYADSWSGAISTRPELSRLLADAQSGDVILVEAIDRLSRLELKDWKKLRAELDAKGLRIVAMDLPTSHLGMKEDVSEGFTGRVLDAINSMMLDTLAAVARKDYEDRRLRQRQGIDKALEEGKFKGRKKNVPLRMKIDQLLKSHHEDGSGYSIREIAKLLGCSTNTVMSVRSSGV